MLLEELGDRLDDGLLPALYEAASVPQERIRAELDGAGLSRWDPATGRTPEVELLDAAADRLTRRAGRLAAARGAAASFGGLATLPPEAAAALVQSLRLAQRMAVVYGHDLDSDAGRILLVRALAAAWEIDLPVDGPVGVRLRDLPEVVRTRLPARDDPQLRSRATRMAGTAARKAMSLAGRRIGRLLPGFGATVSAVGARRALREQGERMQGVLRRAWKGDLPATAEVIDVQEIG